MKKSGGINYTGYWIFMNNLNHDYLFDKDLISFIDEGRLLILSLLNQEDKIF